MGAGLFDFQPPAVVSGVEPVIGPTSGGTAITISGNGLGLDADLDIEAVYVGRRRCTDVVIPSGFAGVRIACNAPAGTGTGHRVLIVTSRNGNSTFGGNPEVSFDYEPPVITSLRACQGNCASMRDSGSIEWTSRMLYAGGAPFIARGAVSNAGGSGAGLTEAMLVLADATAGLAWEAPCDDLTVERTMSGGAALASPGDPIDIVLCSASAVPADGLVSGTAIQVTLQIVVDG